MFAPRARVIVTGDTPRKALVLAKVNDVEAYHVRHVDGTRAVYPASQLQPKAKGQSA